MTKAGPKCKLCGEPEINVDGTWKCTGCGRFRADNHLRHAWLEAHKDEIMDDVEALGERAAREKWKIKPSSWDALAHRWGIKGEKKTANPGAPQPDGTLPALPQFSNDWTPGVQLEWLTTYRELALSARR